MQIPPDFDPSKLLSGFGSKDMKCEVRMMLPFSVQCNTCGEYMYVGKKLTARKRYTNEDYLGIKILRFLMKCCNCNAEFSIRTDPKNSDYACEWGVTRNFEPWRDRDDAIERERKEKDDEEKQDGIKALETRTLASKRQMDMHDALDEIRSLHSRQEKVDVGALLTSLHGSAQASSAELDAEDEELVRAAFASKRAAVAMAVADSADGVEVEPTPVAVRMPLSASLVTKPKPPVKAGPKFTPKPRVVPAARPPPA